MKFHLQKDVLTLTNDEIFQQSVQCYIIGGTVSYHVQEKKEEEEEKDRWGSGCRQSKNVRNPQM